MAMVDWHSAPSQEWDAARDLAADLEDGLGLPDLETTLRLRDGEVLHAELDANCWWYCSADVAYLTGHALVFGGLGSLALTTAASAFGNHRRQRHAEKLAAPQWRPAGNIPVLLTSDRILLSVDGPLTSIWLDDILDITPALQAQRLKVVAEGLQPLELHGPWVSYLCTVLQYLLS
jgi:hypothetical protein